MGETSDWRNKLEETTIHPSKPFSHGTNYFSQPGGETTKPNLTTSEPSYNQDTSFGGGYTKQKSQKETTTNEAGDPREMIDNHKKTPSQNPGIQESIESNLVQMLLSGHSNEATNNEILQMFHHNEAPEIDRRGPYTIIQFKDNEAAREWIQTAKERGETEDNQIKTEMYHKDTKLGTPMHPKPD